jgi:hypothetical protein
MSPYTRILGNITEAVGNLPVVMYETARIHLRHSGSDLVN